MKSHIIQEDSTLLVYLTKHFPEFKKTKLKQLLTFGSVDLNGEIATYHLCPVKKGDKLSFLSKLAAKREKVKKYLPFPLVYEDDAIIVIDKPVGLLTMATEKDDIHTAYHELTEYARTSIPGANQKRGRIYIVHRLDRDVSGLLVFAKTELAKKVLQAEWQDVVKKYYAIVEGTPVPPEGKIESFLAEDEFRRVYSTSERSRDAKHAVTLYRVLDKRDRFSLLEITLITGRKNQIRVHLSDLGHPIVGDEKYGATQDPIGRLGLHGFYLSFRHPVTRELATFESKLPKDF